MHLRLSPRKGPRAGLTCYEHDLLCDTNLVAPNFAVSSLANYLKGTRCLQLLSMVEYEQEEHAERAILLVVLDGVYRAMHLWESDFHAADLLRSTIRTAHLYAHGEASQAAFLDAQHTLSRAALKMPPSSPARWAINAVLDGLTCEQWLAAWETENALSLRVALIAKKGVEDLPTQDGGHGQVWDRVFKHGGIIAFSALLAATDKHVKAVAKQTAKLLATYVLSELPYKLHTLVHLCDEVLEKEINQIYREFYRNGAQTVALKVTEATGTMDATDRHYLSDIIYIADKTGRHYAREFNPYKLSSLADKAKFALLLHMTNSPDLVGLAADYAWFVHDNAWVPLDSDLELKEPNEKARDILMNSLRTSWKPNDIAYEVANELAQQEQAEITRQVLKRVLQDLSTE